MGMTSKKEGGSWVQLTRTRRKESKRVVLIYGRNVRNLSEHP